MADYTLPYQHMIDLVPKNLRNPMVTSLIDNLFDRFLTKDEAVPLYGYVGRKPTGTDRTPKISQPTVERDINTLVPVLSFTVGTETYSFTPQDLIRKAAVLGVNDDQSQWLFSQGNNYTPPIDYDKFTNFFNYFWVADALATPANMPWNPSNAPEYYAITKPALSDLDKLNVRAATSTTDGTRVLTGTGFTAQTWTVLFTSPTDFTVSCLASPGIIPTEQNQSFTLTTPGGASAPFPGPWGTDVFLVTFVASNSPTGALLHFSIVRDMVLDGDGYPIGYESFQAGDQFTITAPFLSNTYSVSFTGSAGSKGKITSVRSLNVYQSIDGVRLSEGDRVLIKNQGVPSQNGIYEVSRAEWSRCTDFSNETEIAGARVFVREGAVNSSALFTSSLPTWTWSLTAQPAISNTNDWQENNYWVRGIDLAAAGVNLAKITQATRPIIEFNSNVQLNSRFDAGGPTDVGSAYHQIKTEFNQAPLFDLYKYDGTHAGKVSTIFFYAEDPTADIDTALQRRVKRAANESGDFVFSHGLVSGNTLLFYKDASQNLHTIWHAGYTTPTIIDQSYSGSGDGELTVTIGTDPFTAQQIWSLTALSPTTFKVSGSKLINLPNPQNILSVGTPYTNGAFNATIVSGTTPFAVGDTFTFRIGNLETTRYVYRDEDDELHDLYGGQNADLNGIGAWQIPRMFYHNVAASSGMEISEGTLYGHFRGVLANQLQNAPEDKAFGGSIKLWSEQQNLLAALLMQRDITPISMIDFAQKQYESGLNAIVDIYLTNLVTYLSSEEVVITPTDIKELVNYILAIRARDNDVRTVLYDSTSGVTGFPITLPQLGITPLHTPMVYFDTELGAQLLKHHDGHSSPLYTYNQAFRDRLISPGLLVKRSDGAYTHAVGSFTTAVPTDPYKGEIWLYPYSSHDEFRVFNVLSDGAVAPIANLGDHWYKRSTGELFTWDGSAWQSQPDPLAPWVAMDPSDVLNKILLEVETRLHANVNIHHRVYFTEADVVNAPTGSLSSQLERELSTWAVTNGYDPMAPDYVSADAFTWNYASLPISSIAPIGGTVPARWFNVLTSHHETFGPLVVPTARPNLEPWKLLGHTSKPSWWDSTYKASTTPDDIDSGSFSLGLAVRTVLYNVNPIITPLTGLPIIDGVQLLAGDTVLLVSEVAPQSNGLWVVSSGFWTRSTQPLMLNTIIPVLEGNEFVGTSWVLSTAPIVNGDPIVFEQIRLWKHQMWLDIIAARPTLKLSVDINRDLLLAPYVNQTLPWAVHALTHVIPPNPANPYHFGEGSPVETVWTKSIEYRYSLARALFRKSPLEFLGSCWGFEWVEVDGILYDGYDISVPGHERFRLHGEQVTSISRASAIQLANLSGPAAIDVSITHDGYTTGHKQSWTIKDLSGVIIGYVEEGVLQSIAANGYVVSGLLIEDNGQPFRVGDSFHITANQNGSGMITTFTPAPYHKILGFGQIFTNALRSASIDTAAGYAIQAYRGWTVNLGYRAGGLISTDDLRISTDAGTLPESAYELRFKRSPFAKDLWLQGLRISVVQIGQSVLNSTNTHIPSTDASDWIFRVEGYNSRYLGIEYYSLNTALEYLTFKALSSEHTAREWRHYREINGVVRSELPLNITGLQNVVNFLFGYSRFLEDAGWRFDDDAASNIDSATGRVRNWQLEIEKFIDAVYSGLDFQQGATINPFIEKVWLNQDSGLLSPYVDTSLFDITTHPGVFDVLGIKMPTNDLSITRSRGNSQISAQIPMFTVHAQIDEYEHLFVFNNFTSPSTNQGQIYDPFSGARIATIKLNGRRQAEQTMRPEFGGHYLVRNEVKRNLQSSADKIAHYYDTDHVFEDELSTRHALALLGFSPKEYMSDLDLNDRTQFNFWRGLVQMKGTNVSIDAFLNSDRFQDAKLDEYWAYKIAEYGDSRSKVFPELKLTVVDTLQQFTKLLFDPINIPADFSAFTVINSDDETRWFSIDDLNQEPHFLAQSVGTYSKDVVPNELITLDFLADRLNTSGVSVTQINATTLVANSAGVLSVTGYGPSTPKFNPVKLFNYVNPELIEEIPLWHPAFGQHTPAALSSINVISDQDPARYNVSTLVSGNENFDPLRAWGAREVGRVWWDTTNLEYTPYSDYTIYQTVDERLNRWGALADFATVDVVEWVESSVPPADYDSRASIDAGNADLDPYTKADGTVYGAKTYERDRLWRSRPIAWSKAGVAVTQAHPSFNASYISNMQFLSNGLAVLETGTFADYGITEGMRIGAWQQDNTATRPLSEYVVLANGFTKHLNGTPTLTPHVTGFAGVISVEVTNHTDKVGQLSFSQYTVGTPVLYDDTPTAVGWDVSSYLRVQEVNSGEEDISLIRVDRGIVNSGPFYGASFTVAIGQNFAFDIPAFGLRVLLTSSVAGTYSTEAMCQFMATNLNTLISMQDAARVSVVVPLSDPDGLVLSQSEFSNDPLDPQYSLNNGVGWRAWQVPTQAQLDADSRLPNSSWVPYIGEFVLMTPSIELIQDAANGATFTMNDGTVIERYETSWTEWTELKQTILRGTSVALGDMTFTIEPNVTLDRISVYVNGVAQLKGTYSLIGTALTIPSIPSGYHVAVIIRAYSPSILELSFDPAVNDNPLIQRQHKIDYQYVEVPVRTDGTITSTKYYFWVKNRSSASRKKTLSVKSLAQLLSEGPPQYLTFQHLIGEGTVQNQYRYDGVTLAGLNYVVTKDDTFKLRFTRNFTLRDDPEQLDLKDTHVEWALIRPRQRTKVPEALWQKMTAAACGQDAAGNTLPSPRRSSYDERNGTRTRFGFGADQVLAPTEIVLETILHTILNTSLVDNSGTIPVPDYMSFLDFSQSNTWFSTPENTRATLTKIWNQAKVQQINEVFFAVLEDICANQYEMTDLFKTSRLSAYSVKEVSSVSTAVTYD